MIGETDHAAHLFASYFHADCLLDDPDWESVVLRFRQSEPLEYVRSAQLELESLLSRSDDAALERFLFGAPRLSHYDPRSQGLSVRAWLEEIVHLLAEGFPRATDSLALSHARRLAASIAEHVLAHNFDPILASRRLVGLRWSVGVADNDPDFTTLVGIDSQTDSLPVGRERQQLSAEALSRLDGDLAKARSWALKEGLPAFENILRRFGSTG